jgi:hypothetical protein
MKRWSNSFFAASDEIRPPSNLGSRVLTVKQAGLSRLWSAGACDAGSSLRCRIAPVTDATSRILRQALELEPDERATLAAALLASLDSVEDDVRRAWAAEIERRSNHAEKERGEDWRSVLDEIRATVLQR